MTARGQRELVTCAVLMTPPLSPGPAPRTAEPAGSGGALARERWPEQISVDELFAALTPAKRPTFIGGYSVLFNKLPARLRDGDLAAALTWVAGRLSGQPKTASFE